MKHPDWTHTILPSPRLAAAPAALGRLWLAWLTGRLQRLLDQLPVWLERSRQRRQLGKMDDRMLRDIGVSRSMAFVETQKWFWQP
jgi:uncharacterized protein YjiS (DUF1127 family)